VPFRTSGTKVEGARVLVGLAVFKTAEPTSSSGRRPRVTKIVNDGPYAEARDVVNGCMLIEAMDLPQAVELSKGCPILEAGGSVEVRPIRTM
jgi:hypothetical protein